MVLVGLCMLADTASAQPTPSPLSPTNIFAPVSTPAHAIHGLSLFVLGVTGVIFVTVFGLLAYALVTFRSRTGDDNREPPQVYGSNQVELAWTVIPVLIVVALFMNQRIDWPWFVISQIAFGIVAGIVVSRQERIATWQPLPLAVREGVEAQGVVDESGGGDAR